MKKLFLLAAILVAFASCTKEQLGAKCNCGVIKSDNVSNYSVTIKNDCSGRNGTFILSPADWMTAYIGSNYCISNVSSW
jgi:hypothetical protein